MRVYISPFLLHLLKVPLNATWDIWLRNTNIDNLNSWSILCAVNLNSFFHFVIDLNHSIRKEELTAFR